jgi:FAD/FMN-containing dehydrogenase
MNQATATSRQTIDELRASLRGAVLEPGQPGFDASAATLYGGPFAPALVVHAATTQDVVRTIAFARETGLELAVRSGGHSSAGHGSVDGGVVLDLVEMQAVDIDVAGRTVWAEAGLTAAELSKAVGAHGLAIGFGDTGSVGIGGISTGGGVGYLVRKFGLTIDSVLGAEVVTADGSVIRTDADHEPDLFWAIRGGGGNVGVVTRFHFRLHEVPNVVGGMLLLPATAEVIAGFLRAAADAPEELSTIANIMPAPPMPMVPPELHGQLSIMALMAYAGDTEAGQRALAPFRALATPIADLLRPMTYVELFPPEDPGYHPIAAGRTFFMDQPDEATAERIVTTINEHMRSTNAQMAVAQLRVLGGAADRVAPDATAYAHRGRAIMGNVAVLVPTAEDLPAHLPWLEGFAAELRQDVPGAYVNFVGDEGPERVHDAYPDATWRRLAAIKARFDPTNLFHRNQNVPPAAS